MRLSRNHVINGTIFEWQVTMEGKGKVGGSNAGGSDKRENEDPALPAAKRTKVGANSGEFEVNISNCLSVSPNMQSKLQWAS